MENKNFIIKRNTSNKFIMDCLKADRLINLPKFYRFNFLNNEINYGKKTTREALAHWGHTRLFSFSPRQKTTYTEVSFFFNPKFKFGFIFTQKSELEDIVGDHQKVCVRFFRVSVHSRMSSFLPEQENNYFTHYSYRPRAFNPFTENIQYGGQFIYPYSSWSAVHVDQKARTFFSINCKEINDLYYKTKLSISNIRHGVYRTFLDEGRRLERKGPLTWRLSKFSLHLRKFRKWALWRNRRALRLLKSKSYLRNKTPTKRAKFLKYFYWHIFRFTKMKPKIRLLRHQKDKFLKPNFKRRKIKSIYVLYSILAHDRKKQAAGVQVYEKLKRLQYDSYTSIRLLKKSLMPSKTRFRKKRHRRPLLRGVYKSINTFF